MALDNAVAEVREEGYLEVAIDKTVSNDDHSETTDEAGEGW